MRENKPIEVECACGNKFKTYQHRINEGKGKFCSKQCMYKYRKERVVGNYTIHKENTGWFSKGMVESNRHRENVPTICGVYSITNPNGEIYIGSSRTIYRRWLRHREARKNVPIHHSIKLYGWRNHNFKVLSELPIDISEQDLINQEQVFIDCYSDCGFKMLNVKKAGHYLKK